MAYALDTNCTLRWLIGDVPLQLEIIENRLAASKSKMKVSDVSIIEAVWVMKKIYHYDDELIAALATKLISHKKIDCSEELFTTVINEFLHSPKVSFVDVYLAYKSSRDDAALLTFDKTLAKKLPELVELAC